MGRHHPSADRPRKAYHYAKQPPGSPCKSDAGTLLLCVIAEKELELGKENNLLSLEAPYPCHTEQRPFQCASEDRKVLLLTAGQRLQQRSGSGHRRTQRGKMGTTDCLGEQAQSWPLSGPSCPQYQPTQCQDSTEKGGKNLRKMEVLSAACNRREKKRCQNSKNCSNPSMKTPS